MLRPKINDIQYGLFILLRGVERSSARMTFRRDVFLAIVQSIVFRRARVVSWSDFAIGTDKLRDCWVVVVGSLRFFLLLDEDVGWGVGCPRLRLSIVVWCVHLSSCLISMFNVRSIYDDFRLLAAAPWVELRRDLIRLYTVYSTIHDHTTVHSTVHSSAARY